MISDYNLEKIMKDVEELKEMGFEDEALLILEDVIPQYPDNIEIYLEQIDIILNRHENSEKDLDKVLEKAQIANSIDPGNIDANYYLGYIFSLKSKWQDAIIYLEKAYQADNSDIDVLKVYGWVLFHIGKQNEGIALLKQSIHIDPFYVEAMEDLAECYLIQEKFSQAQIVIEKGLEIDPNSKRLLNLKLVADSFEIYKFSNQ